jgi:hypothetical protein
MQSAVHRGSIRGTDVPRPGDFVGALVVAKEQAPKKEFKRQAFLVTAAPAGATANIAAAGASINYIGLRNLRASPQAARDTNIWFPVSQAIVAKFDAYIPEGSRSDIRHSLSLLLSLAREGILNDIEGGDEEGDFHASELAKFQWYVSSPRGQTHLSSCGTQISKPASRRWLDLLPERQATARYLIGAAMAASFISGAKIVSAEVTTAPDRQARQAYEACLSSEATKGTYTASDGGISALRLMEQCQPQLDEWRRDCSMATGRTVNQCSLLAASYAQAVLELRKPPSKQ